MLRKWSPILMGKTCWFSSALNMYKLHITSWLKCRQYIRIFGCIFCANEFYYDDYMIFGVKKHGMRNDNNNDSFCRGFLFSFFFSSLLNFVPHFIYSCAVLGHEFNLICICVYLHIVKVYWQQKRKEFFLVCMAHTMRLCIF